MIKVRGAEQKTKKKIERMKWRNSSGEMNRKKCHRAFRCIVLMGKQSIKQYLMRTVAVYSSYLHC